MKNWWRTSLCDGQIGPGECFIEKPAARSDSLDSKRQGPYSWPWISCCRLLWVVNIGRFIIKSLQTFFYLCPKLNELENVIQFSQDKSEKAKFHTFSINCFMILPLNVSRMRQPFVLIFWLLKSLFYSWSLNLRREQIYWNLLYLCVVNLTFDPPFQARMWEQILRYGNFTV